MELSPPFDFQWLMFFLNEFHKTFRRFMWSYLYHQSIRLVILLLFHQNFAFAMNNSLRSYGQLKVAAPPRWTKISRAKISKADISKAGYAGRICHFMCSWKSDCELWRMLLKHAVVMYVLIISYCLTRRTISY